MRSWLIGWFGLSVIIGIGLCVKVKTGIFNDSFWLALSCLLLALALLRGHKWTLVVAIIAGCLLGLYKGSLVKHGLRSYEPFYGKTVVISGLVSQDASYGPKGDQRMVLKNIKIADQHLPGEIWVSIQKKDIKRGDAVTLEGVLSEGFGNTAATMYRANVENIQRPYPGDVARRVRDWFGEGIRHGIPEPQVSLGLGYLLGQKTALPPTLEEQIKAVGLTHAVVASGYNLTILVIFCRRLFLKISKYIATLASSLLVMGFMLITGLSPSMTRAGLVACLGLLVWYYGRKMHPFVLLSFAAGVTALINPAYVWGDLGWYLSFGSFIGVIVLAPLIHRYFWGSQESIPMMRQLVIDTLSAQIMTLPIILCSFGIFSTYALIANILILPFVPFAMLMTFITGIAGIFSQAISEVIGLPAILVLKYSTEVIARVANLPNALIEVSFNARLMIGSYILLAAIISYLTWRTHYDFRSDTQTEHI